MFDRTERLDEFLPINATKQAQTDNAVTNRDLVGSLILTLLIKQLFDGEALFAQSLFEPAPRQMKRGIETGKTRAKFRHERARQRGIRLGHFGDDNDQTRRSYFCDLMQTQNPLVGDVALASRCGQASSHAGEALD